MFQLAFFLLCLSSISYGADICPTVKIGDNKIVCYYEGRKPINDVHTCGCTHIVYTGKVDLHFMDNIAKDIRYANPAAKLFLRVTGKEENLLELISSPLFHGVELHNAHNELDKKKVTSYVEKLQASLKGNSELILSLPATSELLAKYYDMKKLVKYVTMFVLETHYLEDTHHVTFHPSRLSGLWDMMNIDSLVDLLIGLGIPTEKIVVLSPAVAHFFTLSNKILNTPGSPTVGRPGTLNRQEFCKLVGQGEWTLERDQDLSAPYTFNDNKWLAFEDESSLDVKCKYTRIRGLAGHGLIYIDDDNETSCGKSLLELIVKGFSNQVRAPRRAVLGSLKREILSIPHAEFEASSIQVSPYRITRVVDADGVVHAIREDVRTEFECQRQGYFVHPRTCNRFYRCVKFDQQSDEFTVFEFDCPSGLMFDSRYEVCVWPGSIDQGQACPGSSEIAPVPKSRFVCPQQQGYYADPENCRWFFACLDHGKYELTAYEFRCPFGLGFDENKLICDWPWLIPSCGDIGRYESTFYDHGHDRDAVILNGPAEYIGSTADSINVAGYESLQSGAAFNNLIGIQSAQSNRFTIDNLSAGLHTNGISNIQTAEDVHFVTPQYKSDIGQIDVARELIPSTPQYHPHQFNIKGEESYKLIPQHQSYDGQINVHEQPSVVIQQDDTYFGQIKPVNTYQDESTNSDQFKYNIPTTATVTEKTVYRAENSNNGKYNIDVNTNGRQNYIKTITHNQPTGLTGVEYSSNIYNTGINSAFQNQQQEYIPYNQTYGNLYTNSFIDNTRPLTTYSPATPIHNVQNDVYNNPIKTIPSTNNMNIQKYFYEPTQRNFSVEYARLLKEQEITGAVHSNIVGNTRGVHITELQNIQDKPYQAVKQYFTALDTNPISQHSSFINFANIGSTPTANINSFDGKSSDGEISSTISTYPVTNEEFNSYGSSPNAQIFVNGHNNPNVNIPYESLDKNGFSSTLAPNVNREDNNYKLQIGSSTVVPDVNFASEPIFDVSPKHVEENPVIIPKPVISIAHAPVIVSKPVINVAPNSGIGIFSQSFPSSTGIYKPNAISTIYSQNNPNYEHGRVSTTATTYVEENAGIDTSNLRQNENIAYIQDYPGQSVTNEYKDFKPAGISSTSTTYITTNRNIKPYDTEQNSKIYIDKSTPESQGYSNHNPGYISELPPLVSDEYKSGEIITTPTTYTITNGPDNSEFNGKMNFYEPGYLKKPLESDYQKSSKTYIISNDGQYKYDSGLFENNAYKPDHSRDTYIPGKLSSTPTTNTIINEGSESSDFKGSINLHGGYVSKQLESDDQKSSKSYNLPNNDQNRNAFESYENNAYKQDYSSDTYKPGKISSTTTIFTVPNKEFNLRPIEDTYDYIPNSNPTPSVKLQFESQESDIYKPGKISSTSTLYTVGENKGYNFKQTEDTYNYISSTRPSITIHESEAYKPGKIDTTSTKYTIINGEHKEYFDPSAGTYDYIPNASPSPSVRLGYDSQESDTYKPGKINSITSKETETHSFKPEINMFVHKRPNIKIEFESQDPVYNKQNKFTNLPSVSTFEETKTHNLGLNSNIYVSHNQAYTDTRQSEIYTPNKVSSTITTYTTTNGEPINYNSGINANDYSYNQNYPRKEEPLDINNYKPVSTTSTTYALKSGDSKSYDAESNTGVYVSSLKNTLTSKLENNNINPNKISSSIDSGEYNFDISSTIKPSTISYQIKIPFKINKESTTASTVLQINKEKNERKSNKLEDYKKYDSLNHEIVQTTNTNSEKDSNKIKINGGLEITGNKKNIPIRISIVTKVNDYNPLIVSKLRAQCKACCKAFIIRSGKIKNNTPDYDEDEEYDENEYKDTTDTNEGKTPLQPIVVEDIEELDEAIKTVKNNREFKINLRAGKLKEKKIQGEFGKEMEEDNEQSTSKIECKREGLFRHPNNCNKFYSCSWDTFKKKYILHEFRCPIHLSFDNNMGACNWPSQGPACQGDTLLPTRF